MSESLLSQGFDLMIFGMGTVFVFLTVLVLATNVMSLCVQRFLPEPVVQEPSHSPARSAGVDANTMKVLQAAVDAYRGRHRKDK